MWSEPWPTLLYKSWNITSSEIYEKIKVFWGQSYLLQIVGSGKLYVLSNLMSTDCQWTRKKIIMDRELTEMLKFHL